MGSLPRFGPEPNLVLTTATSLIVADVRDGSVLETFPLPDVHTPWRRHGEYRLAWPTVEFWSDGLAAG